MATPARIEALLLVGALAGGPLAAADRSTPQLEVQGGGAVLTQAVRAARKIALDRIGTVDRCRELFAGQGTDGARILLDSDYHTAQPGEAGGLCEKGASAFTGMTSKRTAVCRDSFLKLQPHTRAIVLLHEALHVAGLGQYPHHAGGMTAREIDEMVSRSCDL
jgi:hypothetical protein